MTTWVDRTVFAPVAAARPYLALKATLVLLAFDMWLTRASHAGRYGAGGFNVPHFELLELFQPAVSPALYVGVCVLTGVVALAVAVSSRAPRWLFGLLFALHTFSWAMSMLDSYQHHYLLSLVLLAFAFFPKLTAEDALGSPRRLEATSAKKSKTATTKKRKGKAHATLRHPVGLRLRDPFRVASAWGYTLLAWSIATVYGYTAFAKTDPEWLSGAAFARVLRLPVAGAPPPGADDPIAPFRSLLGAFGIEGETFWWAMGHSVVVVQMICCAGYLLAPLRDLTQSRWLRAFYGVVLATALGFHLGAEYMNLKIGWFSWYMMGYALVFFLPGSWLTAGARIAVPLVGASLGSEVLTARIVAAIGAVAVGALTSTWPLTSTGAALLLLTPLRLVAKAAEASEPSDTTNRGAIAAALLGALALVAVGYWVDLPGAKAASVVAAVALGAGLVGLFLVRGSAEPIHSYGIGALLGAGALAACISWSEVRFDFYRNVGGDHRRRGEYVTAYLAYVKANRYAPEGRGRRNKEEELRALLERRGELPSPEVLE